MDHHGDDLACHGPGYDNSAAARLCNSLEGCASFNIKMPGMGWAGWACAKTTVDFYPDDVHVCFFTRD